MKALLQRVRRASVRVAGEVVGEIGPGLVVLVGVSADDTTADSEVLASKISELRIFPDESGRMNVSLGDASGGALVVSQFTLHADTRRGRRPSFTRAARPEVAAPLIDRVVDALRARGIDVATGWFGAHMELELINDGPVTLMLESRNGRLV